MGKLLALKLLTLACFPIKMLVILVTELLLVFTKLLENFHVGNCNLHAERGDCSCQTRLQCRVLCEAHQPWLAHRSPTEKSRPGSRMLLGP